MKEMLWKIVGVVLFIVVIMLAYESLKLHRELQTIKQQNELEFQRRIHQQELQYDSALRASALDRQHLSVSRDSALASARGSHRLDSINRLELVKIKGKYNKLTSVELSKEMVKQYNER